MENPGNQASEIENLKRTTRDLVAMSTLSAVWGDFGLDGIVGSLAGVLSSMLDLDLAYVRVSGGGASPAVDPLEKIQGKFRDAARLLPAVRAVLDSASSAPAAGEAVTIAHPDDGCLLRVSVVRLGVGSGIGVLVAASRRPGFPSEHDRLLLGVAANQAAVFVQRRLAEQALAHSESRFLDLADAAPAILWVTEPDGSCSFLSRGWYAFTGQRMQDGLGFAWIDAIHPDDRAEARRAFLDANER